MPTPHNRIAGITEAIRLYEQAQVFVQMFPHIERNRCYERNKLDVLNRLTKGKLETEIATKAVTETVTEDTYEPVDVPF